MLSDDDVDQLVSLARDVDRRFPGLVREDGSRAPADVEFAFREERLALLQIRPVVDSVRARSDYYLAAPDAGLRERRGTTVKLDQVPEPAE